MNEKSDLQFRRRLEVLAEIAGNVAALARESGASDSAIRKYLTGSEPTRPVLISLAKATGVRLPWLMDADGCTCEPNSPLLLRARHEIARSFSKVLGDPAYRDEGITGAATQFADEYLTSNERFPVPHWVKLVVPHVDSYEVEAWRTGNLSYLTPSFDERMVRADPLVIAKVASSIRRVLGNRVRELAPEREAELIIAACTQFGKFSNRDMPENILDTFIKFLWLERT